MKHRVDTCNMHEIKHNIFSISCSRYVFLPLSIISYCFPVPFIGPSYQQSCPFLFLSFTLKKICYYPLPVVDLFGPLPNSFLTLFVSQISIAFLICCHCQELRRFPVPSTVYNNELRFFPVGQ